MSTTLTVHLSAAFLDEITGTTTDGVGSGTQGGTWAYLWNETPPPDVVASPLLPAGAAANFTPLVLNGALSSNVTFNAANNDYEVVVNLTDSSLGSVSSSSAYLIVQSQDPSSHTDLTQSTAIGSNIGNIAPNAAAWNYGYAAFEFNLQNKSADQGDLTAIPGFAQHLAVNIDYDNATNQSRGYGLTGQDLITALSAGHTQRGAHLSHVLDGNALQPAGWPGLDAQLAVQRHVRPRRLSDLGLEQLSRQCRQSDRHGPVGRHQRRARRQRHLAQQPVLLVHRLDPDPGGRSLGRLRHLLGAQSQRGQPDPGIHPDQRGHAAEQPVRGGPGHHVDLGGFRVHAALRRSRQRAVRVGGDECDRSLHQQPVGQPADAAVHGLHCRVLGHHCQLAEHNDAGDGVADEPRWRPHQSRPDAELVLHLCLRQPSGRRAAQLPALRSLHAGVLLQLQRLRLGVFGQSFVRHHAGPADPAVAA